MGLGSEGAKRLMRVWAACPHSLLISSSCGWLWHFPFCGESLLGPFSGSWLANSCWAVGLSACGPSTPSLPSSGSLMRAVFKGVCCFPAMAWPCCMDLCCDPPLRLLYTPHGISSLPWMSLPLQVLRSGRLRGRVPPVWTCGELYPSCSPTQKLAVRHATWYRD